MLNFFKRIFTQGRTGGGGYGQTAPGNYGQTGPGVYGRTGPGVRGASGDCPGDLPNPFGICDLTDLAQKIINALLIIAAPIVTIMVLWGAFLIITSAGDPKKIGAGRSTIVWAIVGFGILLLGQGIVSIIESLLK